MNIYNSIINATAKPPLSQTVVEKMLSFHFWRRLFSRHRMNRSDCSTVCNSFKNTPRKRSRSLEEMTTIASHASKAAL